jgi:UDP-glucose 4-epimerase
MNMLVLGGNGFIGSHLVDLLLRNHHFVRVVDKLPERFRNPLEGVDYRIIHFDDKAELAESLTNIDIVYHCISTTVPSTSSNDPVFDIQSNLVNSVSLFNMMIKAEIKRIVFLSSGGTVYGNPSEIPTHENHPLRPISSYGIVKVAIENYLSMYETLYHMKPVILRASNPYGPRQGHFQTQGVISTFLKSIKSNKELVVWGTGDVVRDYIYIDDLVQFCYQASISDTCGVFNVGSGRGACINEIIDIISQVTNITAKTKYYPKRIFDVQRIILDISKASETFQWTPKYSLEEGIRCVWNSINSNETALI